jgi:predicted RNA-binding Zn ribbon-like protein
VSREPADRPAPGELELIRRFVNTLDIDKGTDALEHAEAAVAWLADADILPPGSRFGAGDLTRILRVREAFRAVLLAKAARTHADDAVAVLNGAAADARVSIQLSSPSMAVPVVGVSGIQAALGRLVAITFEAMMAGTWTRLKACPADGCHWAFYDQSRNHSSRWCDMGLCGNRAKRETFRHHHGANGLSTSRDAGR